MSVLAEDAYHVLVRSIASRTGQGVEVIDADAAGAGESSRMLRAILRRPDGSIDAAIRVYGSDRPSAGPGDAEYEFNVLEAARSAGVPVPEPLAFGQAAYEGGQLQWLATRWVAGTVPNPWVHADNAAVARLRESEEFRHEFVSSLVRIHSMHVAARPDGTSPATEGRRFAQRELARWTAVLDAQRVGHGDPVVAFVVAWLRSNIAAMDSATRGFTHGDYRLGNLMVTDDRLSAVLDWEFAQVGDSLYDIGWLVSPSGMVDGLASGLFTPEELIARYEAETGIQVDRARLKYLAVLAGLKNFATWIKLSALPSASADSSTWRARRMISALRVRERLVIPILAGVDGILEVEPHVDRPSDGELAAVIAAASASRADGPRREGSSDRAVSVLRSFVRHASRSEHIDAINAAIGATPSGFDLAQAAKSELGIGAALSDYVSRMDVSETSDPLAPSTLGGNDLRSFLSRWSDFSVGFFLCGYGRILDMDEG
jgi:aminoglycoside phosphotransferase (APT) family kinase protein